ncbi:hypothetical protein BBO_03418 [Beauveria brongniartii RCEF 3172]|uniref:Uncharacterized protein n=1 Tax=Beauveria brongniartii RCEF 3172 TaxID=1081107 RepID=A0A167FUS2_9HYPO|nr:hypothetical protein BBO_03418 [Beauveria brongniartii RCEF 3172]
MSTAQFANGLGNVRIADRNHINPILQGILYSTDRKAQVAVLQEESRRSSSVSSTSSSAPLTPRKNTAISPDVVAHASYSKAKRSKSSLFGMSGYGKNSGVVGITKMM